MATTAAPRSPSSRSAIPGSGRRVCGGRSHSSFLFIIVASAVFVTSYQFDQLRRQDFGATVSSLDWASMLPWFEDMFFDEDAPSDRPSPILQQMEATEGAPDDVVVLSAAATPEHPILADPSIHAIGEPLFDEPAVLRQLDTTCQLPPAHPSVMSSALWTHIRTDTYSLLRGRGAPGSTFPLRTTFRPFNSLSSMHETPKLLHMRVLLTQAFEFSDEFAVLLDTRLLCEVLSARRAMATAVDPLRRLEIAREAQGTVLRTLTDVSEPGGLVLGYSYTSAAAAAARGGTGRRRKSSSSSRSSWPPSDFWAAMMAVAANNAAAAPKRGRHANSGIVLPAGCDPPSARASVVHDSNAVDADHDTAMGGGPRGLVAKGTITTASTAARGSAASVPAALKSGDIVCASTWYSHGAMRAAMESTQEALLLSPARATFHNMKASLSGLRSLGPAYARDGPIYKGMEAGDGALLSVGLLQPGNRSWAGAYLTAFDVLITSSGGLVTTTTSDSKANRWGSLTYKGSKKRGLKGRSGDKAGTSGGVSAPPAMDDDVPHMYHTTCDGPLIGRCRGSTPPTLYDEIIVITHRNEWNIYHWMAESLGKLSPILDYVRAHPHVRIHVSTIPAHLSHKGGFRSEHFALLGLDWSQRIVTGCVRARVVHYPDHHECSFPHGLWLLFLREKFRSAVGLPAIPLMNMLLSPTAATAAASAAASAAKASAVIVAAEGGHLRRQLLLLSDTAAASTTAEAGLSTTTSISGAAVPLIHIKENFGSLGGDARRRYMLEGASPSLGTTLSGEAAAVSATAAPKRKRGGKKGGNRVTKEGPVAASTANGTAWDTATVISTASGAVYETSSGGASTSGREDTAAVVASGDDTLVSTAAAVASNSNAIVVAHSRVQPPLIKGGAVVAAATGGGRPNLNLEAVGARPSFNLSTGGTRPLHIVVLRRTRMRRIAEQASLISALRRTFSPRGAIITELRDSDLPDQTEMFRTIGSADVLVGAHGAGQANAIVMSPGACLVEIIPRNWYVLVYLRMATLLGLKYDNWVMEGDRKTTIHVHVAKVVDAVRACVDSPR